MTFQPLLETGYRPGLVAGIIGLHMDYYAPAWKFGLDFETKLAREIGAFLPRFDAARDLVLSARDEAGTLLASLVLDACHAEEEGVHLRWFIVSDAARGTGLGGRLMDHAMGFCREKDYRRLYLTTFRGLEAARHLYEKAGFRLTAESEVDQWKGGVVEQRFECVLDIARADAR